MSEAVAGGGEAVVSGGEGVVAEGGLGQQAEAQSHFSSEFGEHGDVFSKYETKEAAAKGFKDLLDAYGNRSIPPTDPSAYTIPTVEGFEFDSAQIDGLREVFQQANYSQEQLDLALNTHANIMIQQEQAKKQAISESLESYKQSLGDKYDARVAKANSVIDKINDEGLYNLLKDPQFGHNPVLIEAFGKIAELTAESTMATDPQPSGEMSKEQAMIELEKLLDQKVNERNVQVRQALDAKMAPLHAILNR